MRNFPNCESSLSLTGEITDVAKEDKNPIDASYEKLNTELIPVDKGSDEWEMVEKYVRNTHEGSTPRIANLYKVSREGEEARFKTKAHLGNRMLLWHGSRLTNFVGILSQGLRIAPPEAPASGYRFGKGIYFADIMSLSSRYCRSAGSNDVRELRFSFPLVI